MEDCVFCKIISRELPGHIITENSDLLVIKDRAPKAPIHYLILPKKHIENIGDLKTEDISLVGKLIWQAKKLGEQLQATPAYRLVSNTGAQAGQRVFHLHFHFLAGAEMQHDV